MWSPGDELVSQVEAAAGEVIAETVCQMPRCPVAEYAEMLTAARRLLAATTVLHGGAMLWKCDGLVVRWLLPSMQCGLRCNGASGIYFSCHLCET